MLVAIAARFSSNAEHRKTIASLPSAGIGDFLMQRLRPERVRTERGQREAQHNLPRHRLRNEQVADCRALHRFRPLHCGESWLRVKNRGESAGCADDLSTRKADR